MELPYSYLVEGPSFRVFTSESSGGLRSDAPFVAGSRFTARTM